MSAELLSRLILLIATGLGVFWLWRSIRRLRRETSISKLEPISIMVTLGLATILFPLLSGAAINGLVAVVLFAVGVLLGLVEGRHARFSHRSSAVIVKRSGWSVIVWGSAYIVTTLLMQTQSGLAVAAGILLMVLGLGMTVGSNLVILNRFTAFTAISTIGVATQGVPGTSSTVIPSNATSLARLVIARGTANTPFLDLTGQPVSIGRGPNNTLIVSDMLASTQHAQVYYADGGWVVTDLNSQNGTWVNSNRVPWQYLRPGDQIVIGQTLIVFQSN